MYQALRPFREDRVALRGMDYHVRLWGPERSAAPPLVLAHGWMDVGASYQFVVDAFSEAFAQGRRIIAPDWRGFGHSRLPMAVDTYHFPDYLADLDRLLDHYAGDQAVDLVGHSMGGNIAMFYAGARPARIRRLASLEGFGMPATLPEQAPGRYAQWLDEARQCAQGQTTLKDYADADGVAQRLMKTNPRLAPDKAAWLARHWAEAGPDGRWRILGDAAHKVISAQLYRVEEALALYAQITAPLLHIEASEDSLGTWWKDRYTLAQFHERLRHVPHCRSATVQEAGHMLHHDQPQEIAALLEAFFSAEKIE